MMVIKCPLMDGDVRGFECGNPSIERQIEESYFPTILKQAYGHKIVIDYHVVGYYMLYFKEVKLEDIEQIMGDEYSSGTLDRYVALHIGYIAIDKRFQKKGIGKRVLGAILAELMALSKKYPIRLITGDALLQYHEFYCKMGFCDFPGKKNDGITIPMYIDCMTVKDKEIMNSYIDI